MSSYFIYILKSLVIPKFYVGYSTDPFRRVMEHNSKPYNTYTARYRPWQLEAIFLVGPDKAEAIRIERFIKKQKSHKFLQKLINSSDKLEGELAQLVRVPKA